MADDDRPSNYRRAGQLKPGALLNNAWIVKRLHGRGGMGEVYEGENKHTQQRVALKVLLPQLAADPKTHSLLRSEAVKMAKVRHEAVVHYIMMAEDLDLDITYIVMDFIDGAGLGSVINEGPLPSQAELVALLRRVAGGLAAAHKVDVFHRDLSPDNILLPGRRIDEATIIDFGIAKDPTQATIIGDGFAGKYGFVAPEQLGEYGGEIGAFTDIYSLALTALPLHLGHLIDMGTSPAMAVMRRRDCPDLSAVPEPLRGLFSQMLQPNPANRFQSMTELVAALDGIAMGVPVASAAPRPILPPAAPAPPINLGPPPTPTQRYQEADTQLAPGSNPPQPQPSPLPPPEVTLGQSQALGQILAGSGGGGPAQRLPPSPQPYTPQPYASRPVVQGGVSPVLVGGGILMLVAIVAAVAVSLPHPAPPPPIITPDNSAMDNTVTTTSDSNATTPTTDSTQLATTLIGGKWSPAGLSCDADAIDISADNGQLTVGYSSGPVVGAIQGVTGNVVSVSGDDGVTTYSVAGDTLTKTNPQGQTFPMTRCPAA